ncbi:MAG: chemotaxis protein, partial [Deltaproteobacteria bacterium]|nr:chemotaxis protein [Deltaproteobacteria bacterium]
MKPFKITLQTFILILLLGACSLLQLKVETGTVPLTKEELNMRIMTRYFTLVFFNAIENTADEIIANSGDRDLETYALLWKIHATEGVQKTVYQTSPVAGLVDTWVYVQQMTDFFTTGPGKDLFGEYQKKVVATSKKMLAEIAILAQTTLDDGRAASTKPFVEKHAKVQAFNNLSFSYIPSYRAWLDYHDIKAEDAVPNLGTMPEAFGDLSDRMSSISNQTPKIIAWKAELLARKSQLSPEQ